MLCIAYFAYFYAVSDDFYEDAEEFIGKFPWLKSEPEICAALFEEAMEEVATWLGLVKGRLKV